MPRLPRILPTLFIATLALASPAFAQPYPAQVDLSWSDCVLGPYSVDMANDCTTNDGLMGTLYVSFVPPGLMPLFLGSLSVIDLQTSGATLSPWWHLESTGCRNASLSANVDFTHGPTSCADFWNGQASYGFNCATPSPHTSLPNSARIKIVAAVPSQFYGPIDNSKVWYAYTLIISNSQTVGAGACSGCLDGACIVVNQMQLTQPLPAPDVFLTSGPQQYVTYRGGAGPGAPCPQSTPVHRNSWGSIKSLYR
jgi:hypothetical protein